MANMFLTLTRAVGRPLITKQRKLMNNPYLQRPGFTHLYSAAALGIESFIQQQNVVKERMENIAQKFREKMQIYSGDQAKGMIFTEDLKNMIHLAEDEKDLDVIVKMMKKFNQQNKQLRFGSYIFGPVVMRLFHHLNQTELALKCFKDKELNNFFDQVISYQILLDLLYENQKYEEILEAYNMIKERQIEGIKHPRNVIVLTLAACYKLNSEKSWEFAMELWKELMEAGHFPMRRATTFMAGLALKKNRPDLALEILETARNQNYATVRGIKLVALSSIGRVEEAVNLLKTLISQDAPDTTLQTINKDVMEVIAENAAKSGSMELSINFGKLKVMLEKQGQVSDMSLDQQICLEIQAIPKRDNRLFGGNRRFIPQNRKGFEKYQNVRTRPGLQDLV